MKLCLGTVQFGLDYGISNTNGRVGESEVQNILDFARAQGIDTIDTAQSYGQSEAVLGKCNLSGFKIITKLRKEQNLETSLSKLNVRSVYAVMLHNENEIDGTVCEKLLKYKEARLTQKTGISVYTPEKLRNIIKNYDIDIVQFPLNILDQRFLPLIPELKKRSIEVHSRSVFLQGLLLMDDTKIPGYFAPIKSVLAKMPDDKLGFAVQFVKNIEGIDKVVVGVTSKKELEGIVNAFNKKTIDYSSYAICDESMINPSMWGI